MIEYEAIRSAIVGPYVAELAQRFVQETGANARVESTEERTEVVVTDREQVEKEFGTFDIKPTAWVYRGVFAIGGRIQ